MSTEENKAVVRRYMGAFWDGGDASVADEVIAPSYAVHDPGTPGREGGVAGEKQVLALYYSVFPDFSLATEELLAEGDTVAARWTVRGTHRGALNGIAPTGKAVTISGISLLRVRDRRIVEHWLNWDTLGMLQQVGAIPAAW
jgi:predicted ester cyclase